MKKKVCILLSLLLIVCVLFSGCSNDNSQVGSNNPSSSNNSQQNTTESENDNKTEIVNNGSIVALDGKSFSNHIKTIELTKENWKDYLELVREEKTNTYTDAFGEVISTESYVNYRLKIKDMGQFTCGFSDAVIEVIDPRSGEPICFVSSAPYYYLGIQFDNEYSIDTKYTIDDFECARIKGEIILIVDIPQEVLRTDDKKREYFFTTYKYDEREEYMRFDNYRNKNDDGIQSLDIEAVLNWQ